MVDESEPQTTLDECFFTLKSLCERVRMGETKKVADEIDDLIGYLKRAQDSLYGETE